MFRYIAALFFLVFSLNAYEDYSKLAQLYAQNQAYGTDYLAFRDIPILINNYLPVKKNLSILDYGCGAGLSTRFLKQILPENASIVGVDISDDMLKQALLADPKGLYLKMESTIPSSDSAFDLVYCNFVLFELPSYEEIIEMLKEIHRTMKTDGYLIATTGTPEMYNRHNHWATLDPDFSQNDHLQSGSLAKVSLILPDGTITFNDYYWTEKDYLECFAKAGFSIVSISYPIGAENEILSWEWKDETKVAPYVIFLLKK